MVLLLLVEFCTYIRGFDGVEGPRIDYIIASRFEWMSRFHMTYVTGSPVGLWGVLCFDETGKKVSKFVKISAR